jgi:VWFA-related protein
MPCRSQQSRFICSLLSLTLFLQAHRADSQTVPDTAQGNATYGLSIAVDEVSLTFHAAGPNGTPVNDLELDELRLLDNGKPPRRILAFRILPDAPIRAGILMDTSQSMEETRAADRAIAIEYARRVLRQQTDQAFVMNFDSLSVIAQSWTSDSIALTDGIRNLNVTTHGKNRTGTAIFDSIYRACLGQFSHIDNASSGNFILLFSDGVDNASRTPLQLAVDTCQQANTAIYAFRPISTSSLDATGPKTLAELASKTGGRVFRDDDQEAGILEDLRLIEGDLRNQYRLIYKPADFQRNGSFHRIELKAPERVDTINVRSGYYAPMH